MIEKIANQNIFDRSLMTNRLCLRRLNESDDSDMFEYTRNPEVTRFLSWEPQTEIAQTRQYISKLIAEYNSGNSYAWAVEIADLKKFIGVVRIFDVSFGNKRGELSYVINPVYQGKGFAFEAIKAIIEFCFSEVGLNRIQAKCTVDNLPSERVLQKLGMSYEGTLREYWINKGVLTDAKIYSVTVADFLNI
jgi:[ribosomal protein S5]-alanine N-acetyltransferase